MPIKIGALVKGNKMKNSDHMPNKTMFLKELDFLPHGRTIIIKNRLFWAPQ